LHWLTALTLRADWQMFGFLIPTGQLAKLFRLTSAVKIYIKTWFSKNKSGRFNKFTPRH